MNISEFPLFQQLHSTIKVRQLTHSEKEWFINKIKSLTESEQEHMFALIRFHQIYKNNLTFIYTLPYEAKQQKKGVKFDMDKFPFDLQCMVFEFVKKCI